MRLGVVHFIRDLQKLRVKGLKEFQSRPMRTI